MVNARTVAKNCPSYLETSRLRRFYKRTKRSEGAEKLGHFDGFLMQQTPCIPDKQYIRKKFKCVKSQIPKSEISVGEKSCQNGYALNVDTNGTTKAKWSPDIVQRVVALIYMFQRS